MLTNLGCAACCPLRPGLARRRRKLQAIATLAQLPNFREHLLRWEKTASDCDQCSVSTYTKLITHPTLLLFRRIKGFKSTQSAINLVYLLNGGSGAVWDALLWE
ncbi:hypothetical protein [Microcoleus sp. T2B6]|uniref:hypothetical protein n=1 Tax=Microcoleus sp. T2B6 TaxID=3055424 RepID=UPI002FD468D9